MTWGRLKVIGSVNVRQSAYDFLLAFHIDLIVSTLYRFGATVASNGPPYAPGLLSCLSACNFGVLWPNGWMDQDATWYGGRSRPRQHCFRWGPGSPHGKGYSSPHFSAHVCYGQTAGRIRIPLGTVGGPRPRRHCVTWGPSSPTERGTAAPTFRPMSIVAKRSPISATAEFLSSTGNNLLKVAYYS